MTDVGVLTAKLILNADDFCGNADTASSKAEKLGRELKNIGEYAKSGLKSSVIVPPIKHGEFNKEQIICYNV